jgi:transcriptional regulator with XRE-family HTH domain
MLPNAGPPAPDPDPADLAARTRSIRQAAGISLPALAREANLSKSHVSLLEQGKSQPGPRSRRWLAIIALLDATN